MQSSPLEYLYEHLSMTDKALVDRGEVADGLEELGESAGWWASVGRGGGGGGGVDRVHISVVAGGGGTTFGLACNGDTTALGLSFLAV